VRSQSSTATPLLHLLYLTAITTSLTISDCLNYSLQEELQSLSPKSELWLGESAACAGGGVAGVTNAFEGVLWYVDAV
jgi:hypothetical protein